jgi:hypothetical protein
MRTSPNINNYQLGRGKIYGAEWSSGSAPTPASLENWGNCPSFDLNLDEETLEHISSMEGLKEKDAEVTLQNGYNITFTLDEATFANFKKYLRGSSSGNVIHAMQATDKYHAIKFVADNPIELDNSSGEKYKVFYFWKVKIKPGGAVSLITDEWLGIPLTAEGISDRDNHSSSPWFDVTFGTSTTTTTS